MIRKVIIGPDYKNSMVYSIGQKTGFDMDHGGVISIDTIVENNGMVEIYVINEKKECELWKEIPTAFCSKEHDLQL